MELEIEMLANIRTAMEEHDGQCESEAKAILMNPGNFELIGWDEVLGVPVLPDPRVEPKRARLVCGVGRAGFCDEGDVWWDDDGRPYVILVSAENG